MRIVTIALLLIVCANWTLAEEPSPASPPGRQQEPHIVYPVPEAQPRRYVEIHESRQPSKTAHFERYEHLFRAAEHLSAAGLSEQAERIREQAEEEAQRAQAKIQLLLMRKEAELKALQSEVDQLRQGTGLPQQVMIQVKVCEIDRRKLKMLATENEAIAALTGADKIARLLDAKNPAIIGVKPNGFTVIEAGGQLESVTKLLAEKGVLRKVLAEPIVVTVSGRQARFHSGGTEVEFLPTVLGNGKIRTELNLRLSDPIPGQTDGSLPNVNVRQVQTAVELLPGQALVLSGLVAQSRPVQPVVGEPAATPPGAQTTIETELLVLLTPTIVEPPMDAPHSSR